MELGGNLPESLIEHMMLPPPEASDNFADSTETTDRAGMNVQEKPETIETNQIEEEEEEEEEPLKAGAGR